MMSEANIHWTWITMTAALGGLGAWVLLHPRGFLGACNLGRILPSDFDILSARLVGGGLLWAYALQLPGPLTNTLLLYLLNAVWIVCGGIGGVLFVRDFVYALSGRNEAAARAEVPVWQPMEGESAEQTRERYRAAWRKYNRLRIAFPLSIPAWFVIAMLLGSLFRRFGWEMKVLSFIALAWIPVMAVLGWQWMYWRCPRCGNAFKGKRPFFGKRCYYCRLPKWAESPEA